MIQDGKAFVLYRAGPTGLALLLALVAWPVVALTLGAVDPRYNGVGPALPASTLGQWSAAGGAVFLSALVAGPIGGLVVRRKGVVVGGVFTFVLALVIAIESVSFLPMLLGQNLGVACQSAVAPGFSSSPCDPTITTGDLATDLQAVLFFWLAPFVEPIPVLALAVGVSVWTAVVARSTWLGNPIASKRSQLDA